MKPFHKAILGAAVVLVIAVLVWGGGILYWHFQIRSALRTFEATFHAQEDNGVDLPRNQEAMEFLFLAGCRSLPYMVESLDNSRDPLYQSIASFMITRMAYTPGAFFAEGSTPALERASQEWSFRPDAPLDERRLKCARIRDWWRDHGSEFHQVWRFWTSACRPYEEGRDGR